MDKPTPPKTITTRMLGTGPAVEFVFLADAIAHGEAMAAWGAAQEQAKLIHFLQDDAAAITYQSLGQYRSALIRLAQQGD